MRIGIDIRKYYDYGIGTYIQNLVRSFQESPEFECVYVAPDEFKSTILQDLKGDAIYDNASKYSVRELFSISQKANARHLNLYHVPHYTLPFNLKMPSIVTVHDIIHIRMKEYYSLAKRSYAYMMVRHACAASDAVIVDSEFGKRELLDMFRVDEKKIHVIHLGVHQSYFQRSSESELASFRNRYSISKPYILYTGSLKPHKNIPVLLKAMSSIVQRHDVQFVFTGEKISDHPQLLEYVRRNQLQNSLIDLGRIGNDDLRFAYQSAAVVVLPSLYEGFGFSMLEAMASGVPAIGARSASIPEVVGEAGLMFNPKDPAELTLHIETVLTNTELRKRLIHSGSERAGNFSWKQCVDKTIDIYRQVAQ